MRAATAEADQQYLMRRAAQEEAAARNATDPRVRDSHLEMARRYREACGRHAASGDVSTLSRL